MDIFAKNKKAAKKEEPVLQTQNDVFCVCVSALFQQT